MTTGTPENRLLEQRFYDDSASLKVAYLLVAFLGPLGVHRLYLGFRGSAFLMMILTILGVATLAHGVGLLPLAAVAFWWIWDLLRLPRLYDAYVRQFRRRLSANLAIG